MRIHKPSLSTIGMASLMTVGDLNGLANGTKHKGSKKPMHLKVVDNRKKEKAARKARKKNR